MSRFIFTRHSTRLPRSESVSVSGAGTMLIAFRALLALCMLLLLIGCAKAQNDTRPQLNVYFMWARKASPHGFGVYISGILATRHLNDKADILPHYRLNVIPVWTQVYVVVFSVPFGD